MNADVPNLVLEHLRAIREDLAGVRTTLAEHGQRLRGIEIGQIRERRDRADDAETVVHLQAQVDRLSGEVNRIKRRLDIVD